MQSSIIEQIQLELNQIEAREKVKIIFACESGSRAWGFASEDSDYDVRFIYLRPTAYYLSLQPQSDVIEKPIDNELDISGWDITKVLLLLRKSNPPLLEWLQSPIIYREVSTITAQIRELMPEYFSPKASMYHYLHLAQNSFKEYTKTEKRSIKKCFYILRSILACKWIESDLGVVPTEFATLMNKVIKQIELREAIEELLIKKKNSNEAESVTIPDIIANFMTHEIDRLCAENQRPSFRKDYSRLDELFLTALKQINELNI